MAGIDDFVFQSDALDVDQDHFLLCLEEAVPVSLISTFDNLVDCEASDTVAYVIDRTDTGPFDHLPVKSGGTSSRRTRGRFPPLGRVATPTTIMPRNRRKSHAGNGLS